mmetsp:Transcript_6311/g.11226  ORF Transcript_6311/g.11226 Transcript_6311/m.11226 type:complete len:172 (-) Transcript_6311:1310-1825(-)
MGTGASKGQGANRKSGNSAKMSSNHSSPKTSSSKHSKSTSSSRHASKSSSTQKRSSTTKSSSRRPSSEAGAFEKKDSFDRPQPDSSAGLSFSEIYRLKGVVSLRRPSYCFYAIHDLTVGFHDHAVGCVGFYSFAKSQHFLFLLVLVGSCGHLSFFLTCVFVYSLERVRFRR